MATIARALRVRAPGVRPVLVSNAAPEGLGCEDLAVFAETLICDRSAMAARVARAGCGLAVLDTLQLPGIAALPMPTALILRQTPDHRLSDFGRDDGRPWDRVIVPNPAGHWMPQAGPEFARRVDAAGWILRPTGARGASEASSGIVVATGGGGTPQTRALLFPLLDAVIAEARAHVGHRFVVRQAIGPRAAGARLVGVDEVFDPGGDLNTVFRAADLVISTAGYNSVLELASTDTPALLATIPRSLDDQAERVRLWGPKLGFGLEPGREDEAARWLADRIAAPGRRTPVDLGQDGAARAADLLLEMLCPVS